MQIARTAYLCACISEVQQKDPEGAWRKRLEVLDKQRALGVISWQPEEMQNVQQHIMWIPGFVGQAKKATKPKRVKSKLVDEGPRYDDAQDAAWRWEQRVGETEGYVRDVAVKTDRLSWTFFEKEASRKLLLFYDNARWGEEQNIEVEIEKKTYTYKYKVEGGAWMSQQNLVSNARRMVQVRLLPQVH